jgi:hypothetical protein
MKNFSFDGWTILHDPQATREMNAVADLGAERCACPSCRNFVAVRDEMYPRKFLEILAALGLERHKEYDVCESGPSEYGGRYYSGNYRFVGSVERDPGDRMTDITFDAPNGPTWSVFFSNTPHSDKPRAVAVLEFWVELPWRLDESPEG